MREKTGVCRLYKGMSSDKCFGPALTVTSCDRMRDVLSLELFPHTSLVHPSSLTRRPISHQYCTSISSNLRVVDNFASLLFLFLADYESFVSDVANL